MNSLVTNKLFLISSLLFVGLASITLWMFYPPALRSYRESQDNGKQLDSQIAEEQAKVTNLKQLTASSVQISNLALTAAQALPSSVQSDLLLLQLDGLTKTLGLNATITVPFASGNLVSQLPTPVAEEPGEVKAGSGSAGSSTPVVSTTASSSDFTVSGAFGFTDAQKLISGLKTLIRWNKIRSIEISQSGDTYSTIVTAEAFSQPSSAKDFSGSVSDLLTRAEKLFGSYKSFSATPNIATEGQFGKADPFR